MLADRTTLTQFLIEERRRHPDASGELNALILDVALACKAISRAEKLPKTDRPLPIVLAGGTARPKGFRELFERTLRSRPFPIEVAEVRVAADPFTATARGAYIAAMFEK